MSDSANTATAFLSGVKGNYGTIGVNAQVPRDDCHGAQDTSKQTVSITKWAQDYCKATGFVTTARVTHATPAGVYAHTASRYWENDAEIVKYNCNPTETIDIARQLLENDVAKRLKVILGGGRREFRDSKMADEESGNGFRTDGRNLIAEWLSERNRHGNASYVWHKQALQSIEYDKTDYLMGLFEPSHCMYTIDIRDQNRGDTEPTLREMTEVALKLLQKQPQGYFLFVESAHIDMAHHATWARRALDETKEFSDVIDMVRKMTNESDTLIIVTSDHSHVMTYNGYPVIGKFFFDQTI